jgi:prepilin-type N-terminal cleavage/methylation domain-containing protein
MDCKITSTTSTKARQQGLSLVELLTSLGIGSILLVAILSLSFFSARSFAALTNYVDLDNHSRNALDHITREIRQADALISSSSTQLEFKHGSGWIRYTFNPTARLLTRNHNGHVTVLLRECDELEFKIYQRNPVPQTWDQFDLPTNDPTLCKMVQLSWVCSRTILGARVNTESVQSAKVVIRKK